MDRSAWLSVSEDRPGDWLRRLPAPPRVAVWTRCEKGAVREGRGSFPPLPGPGAAASPGAAGREGPGQGRGNRGGIWERTEGASPELGAGRLEGARRREGGGTAAGTVPALGPP